MKALEPFPLSRSLFCLMIRVVTTQKPVKKGLYPLRPGVQGVFLTCDGGRERQATNEALNLLETVRSNSFLLVSFILMVEILVLVCFPNLIFTRPYCCFHWVLF